jgi:hypothetical protein
MSFAYPWMLWLGAVAAAVPLLVHVLTRPRPVTLPLSTLRFVREALRERRAVDRLRDRLILLARTAAIGLLAAAFAGPQWGKRPLVSPDEAGEAVRVVVLDVSQSMAAADGGVAVFERARTRAGRYLQYRPGLAANVLLAGARTQAVFDEPSTNTQALREELSRAAVRPEHIDLPAALELAARMLAPTDPADQRRRELVIVSDFQRSGWAAARFDPLPPQTRIQLESVAPPRPPANFAVTRAVCRPLGAAQDRLLLEIEVGNFSPAARTIELEVELGETVYRWSAVCPPRQTTSVVHEVAATHLGWQWGEARLVGIEDALAADDVRPLVVQRHGQPVYALVTREPPERRLSSSRLVEWALVPAAASPGAANGRTIRLDPATLDTTSLQGADMVVLVRCGRLDQQVINLLAGQMRRGRPLLYLAGEPIDAENLKALSASAGEALQVPVEFVAPPPGHPRRDLFLTSVRREQPPFSVFGDSLPAVLGQWLFRGGLSSRRVAAVETAVEDAVLATYNDGTAAIVLTDSDAGSLAVLNADLAASNIWRTAAFVPLLDELVQRMLQQRGSAQTYVCGQPLVARLPAESGLAAQLQLVSPADRREDAEPGRLSDEGAGTLWQWTAPDHPGVYRVVSGQRTVHAAAVGIPAEESDLETLQPEVIRERLTTGRQMTFRSRDELEQQPRDLWKWLVVGVVLCFLLESAGLTALRT